ncbi:MAG: hypothetical protein ACE5FI_14070 [Anaerolineales bacterium]
MLAVGGMLLAACLASPPPPPTPTATAVPPTATPAPTATLPPAATPTQFAPPIDLTAIRTVRVPGIPTLYNPARSVLSGLIPVRALALGPDGRTLFVVAGAQESPGNLQLYQVDLETGAFTSSAVLAGFSSVDALLALPTEGESAGVLLSGCMQDCGLWRVQLYSAEIVQLASATQPLRALHYIRDGLGQPFGLSFLGPAVEGETPALLITHDFMQEPYPVAFETGAALLLPADNGQPVDFMVVQIGDLRRAYLALETGEIRVADVTSTEVDKIRFKPLLDLGGDLAGPVRLVEGVVRYIRGVDDRLILRFDRLEDACGNHQRAMGEEVLLTVADGGITITRIALSRTSEGMFDEHLGVFQTLDSPGDDLEETYTGRIQMDGTISGLYKAERDGCPVTYAISGRLDPPPNVVPPPMLAAVLEENVPALALQLAGGEAFSALVNFPEVQPALVASSALTDAGELTLAFNHESGIQIVRVVAAP